MFYNFCSLEFFNKKELSLINQNYLVFLKYSLDSEKINTQFFPFNYQFSKEEIDTLLTSNGLH